MKPILKITSLVTLLFILFIHSGCKKDETPDYPHLIGYWSGTTSQGNPIRFKVDSRDGILYITQYELLVNFGSGAKTFEQQNDRGIVALSGLIFSIPLGTGSAGPAYIDGNFIYGSTEITLSGSFAVYYPGSPVDIVTGSYLAYQYK